MGEVTDFKIGRLVHCNKS